METKNKIDISVVIPFYNEAKQCIHTLNVMDALLAKLPYRFELVAVNDGSKDNTDKLLSEHSMEQVRFKYVCLSRNFGKESAILAGMSVAEGEAVIFMDGDLQHPPELIPEMIKKWKEGYDVVNAVKQSRGHESFLYKCFSLFFYSLISKATNADLKGHSDFKLLDREVVDILEVVS
jgi:dolichol-phosphate mannosyltransferase